MGTATLTITDTVTSMGVIFRIDDSGAPETDSPPPATESYEWDRAIIQHPIPNRDDDIGQDMGSYSRKLHLAGICQQDIKDQLENWVSLPQFGVSFPSGRFNAILVDKYGVTRYSKTSLAMKSLSSGPAAGRPKWFNFTALFVEFHQT
jgi:hypothetical protein